MHDTECQDGVSVDELRREKTVAPYKLSDIMPKIAYQVSLSFQNNAYNPHKYTIFCGFWEEGRMKKRVIDKKNGEYKSINEKR